MIECKKCGSGVVREVTDNQWQISTFEWNDKTKQYDHAYTKRDSIGGVELECQNGHRLTDSQSEEFYKFLNWKTVGVENEGM